MGMWILEPKSDEPVPGTVHLQADVSDAERAAHNHHDHLKRGTGKHSDIVLAPQPSESPNDPLNWSPMRKWYTSIFLSIGTGLMAGTHNFVNPANALMAKYFHTSISTISQSVSIILLTLGLSAVISSPAARIWGKRPVILVGNAIAVVGYIIVVARSHSLVALYVGRGIHGLGIAALEYLVSSSVGDLFFVHERGVHLALWHYALSGGNALGQVIGSQIVAAQTWVWPFTYTIIIITAYSIIFFFTCPETTYIRAKKYDIDIQENASSDSDTEVESSTTPSEKEKPTTNVNVAAAAASDSEAAAEPERKKTYLEQLRVYNGRFSDESFVRSLITPWRAFLLPAVVWASFAYGCSVAFAASFSVALGQIFTKPPYGFTTSQVGLTVLSSFVGATLGNAIPGPLSDWTVKFLSRHNRGVYEPEFRIVLTVPAFILGLMGFWGFGMSLQAKSHWMWPTFFYGLAIFAGSVQSLISNTYLLDCHRAYAQDGYAAVTIVRGIFSFAMTFAINSWISRDGYQVVYFWVGTIHGLSCIMGMVLYVYGKRIRLALSKSAFIKRQFKPTPAKA